MKLNGKNSIFLIVGFGIFAIAVNVGCVIGICYIVKWIFF